MFSFSGEKKKHGATVVSGAPCSGADGESGIAGAAALPTALEEAALATATKIKQLMLLEVAPRC